MANGQSFWKGFAAGAVSSVIPGLITAYSILTVKPLPLFALLGLRFGTSILYNYTNEYFQYGNIKNADHGLFLMDALWDTTLSLFYYDSTRAISNAILSSAVAGLFDGAIDIYQSVVLSTQHFKTTFNELRSMVGPELIFRSPIKPIYI